MTIRRARLQNADNKRGRIKLLKEIGSRVKTLRSEARLTQADLAKRATLSPRFVAQIEAGQGNVSILRLAEVASALGRPLQDLIPPTRDGSLHAEIWHLLTRCRDEDRHDLRDWLRQRFGDNRSRFITLVGLRGAGKSTVGVRLAQRLKTKFIELDSLIEQAAGMSLGEIFALHGEDYYRRLERTTLTTLFRSRDGGVIAVGGSLVTDPENWGVVKRRCLTVWLRALPQEHMSRVQKQGDTRPMQGHPAAMAELKSLLARREPLYSEADVIIRTSGKSPNKIATEIVKAAAI